MFIWTIIQYKLPQTLQRYPMLNGDSVIAYCLNSITAHFVTVKPVTQLCIQSDQRAALTGHLKNCRLVRG